MFLLKTNSNLLSSSAFSSAFAAAVVNSGVEGADEREVTRVMSAIADRVVHEFVEPFTFPNQHQRILEPYNYYEFGQVGVASFAICSNFAQG